MNRLKDARTKINEIDKKMAELFTARMQIAEEIAACKQEMGLSILDTAREAEVIEENCRFIENEVLRNYYADFLKHNMSLSRRYQHRLMEGMRVAYSGVPGAFAHIAVCRIFPDAAAVAYKDFNAAYDAVENGECDCVVLPIENSYAGEVSQVMDLAFFGTLSVNGIYNMEIVQNLVGIKGTAVRDVKEVVSHAQGLAQCEGYIRDHALITHESANTALAAKKVADEGNPAIAAIASVETAEIYGLEVLDKNINAGNVNTTRFAVFSRVGQRNTAQDDYFILNFTVKNEAGSLVKALSVIGEAGFNLRALKSRPTKDSIWEYYFFAEGEGNINSTAGEEMLHRLKDSCNNIKVVGSFSKEKIIR